MTMTYFAMVEEVASLVRDNLYSKHLVLSVEESLVRFLQEDTSSKGVIELEPMNSYNRLLLHRLSYIFGFAHESIGEGDNRHLVLERCSETSIPPILVSDILLKDDVSLPPAVAASQQLIIKRNDSFLDWKSGRCKRLEEREASYMAARERIFCGESKGDEEENKQQKPRSVPVVARRMISHALGKKVNPNANAAQGANLKSKGDELKEVHLGGAKRIFAHALGRGGTRNRKDDVVLTE